MTFLPIVARELRVSARKWSTYWIRFTAAALALVICGWTFLFFTQMGAAGQVGKILFGGAVGLAWLFAVAGGVFKTADALSEEKRDGTLGLLFLTDLKGHDIVLGKMVAASVNWFFALIALFPVLAVSLLLGGVAPGEFWRSILALTNLLFYSLALGLFVSSFMRNERHSAGLTIALLVLLLWLPGELAGEHQQYTGRPQPSPWFVLPGVLSPFQFAKDYDYGRQPHLYWQSLGVSHGVAWFFVALASVIVPRTWQQQAGRVSRWQERAGQLGYGLNAARRKLFREKALALNPFYWVAARARQQSLAVFVVLLFVTLMFGASFWFNDDWNEEGTYFFTTLCLHSILKVWLALAACRRFVDDRRSGGLELILSTPLPPREIVHGQWLALLRQFGGPVAFVLLVDALLLLSGASFIRFNQPRDLALFFAMFGANLIVFLADLVALAWLSMWRGLKARHSYTAWLWCVVQVLVLPWIVFYVGVTVFLMVVFLPRVLATAGGGGAVLFNSGLIEWMPHLMTGLWFVLCLPVSILSAWWSRRCLRLHFRTEVTRVAISGATMARRPAATPPPLVTPPPRTGSGR